MKQYRPLLLVILFPYFVIFALVCTFTNFLMEIVFQNNGLLLLLVLIIIHLIALICAITEFIKNILKKRDAQEILHMNMIIKLLHIPAYIIIFLIGLLCTITIFTMGITIILIVLDSMTIFLSGLIGLCGLIRCLIEKKISLKKVIIHGIFQFMFCADVISSIIVYKRIKNNGVRPNGT